MPQLIQTLLEFFIRSCFQLVLRFMYLFCSVPVDVSYNCPCRCKVEGCSNQKGYVTAILIFFDTNPTEQK
ncbi:MAG: hypothetical protein JG781_1223 [Peptococcaceae bacterium]|jgi:hypothetical protein|nr:hypothetical protein [Peptococcaceae bacterium]